MTIVKTSELTGPALDWAVAKCEGWKYDGRTKLKEFQMQQLSSAKYCYSTVWAKGGPIIEREEITLHHTGDADKWRAYVWSDERLNFWPVMYGPSPLIAAMRCYVASKIGDSVEIPSELI